MFCLWVAIGEMIMAYAFLEELLLPFEDSGSLLLLEASPIRFESTFRSLTSLYSSCHPFFLHLFFSRSFISFHLFFSFFRSFVRNYSMERPYTLRDK